MPIAPNTRNTPLQLVKMRMPLPAIGASISTRLFMSISNAKNFVSSDPLYKSRTIAREITIPPAVAKPCIKRAPIKICMEGARAQAIKVAKYNIRKINRGCRLP